MVCLWGRDGQAQVNVSLAVEGKAHAVGCMQVRDTVLDATLWSRYDLLVKVSEPIYAVLRLADTPTPNLSKIYPRMLQMKADIETMQIPAAKRRPIIDAVANRVAMATSDIAIFAAMLDPEHRKDKALHAAGHAAFVRMLKKLIGEGTKRLRDQRGAALVELSKFVKGKGLATELAAASMMPAWEWWQQHAGDAFPQLQPLAITVLAQCTSASASERNWSNYAYIHSRQRNRLTFERARDLVYLFANLRLKRRLRAMQQAGVAPNEYVPWRADDTAEDSGEETDQDWEWPGPGQPAPLAAATALGDAVDLAWDLDAKDDDMPLGALLGVGDATVHVGGERLVASPPKRQKQ